MTYSVQLCQTFGCLDEGMWGFELRNVVRKSQVQDNDNVANQNYGLKPEQSLKLYGIFSADKSLHYKNEPGFNLL